MVGPKKPAEKEVNARDLLMRFSPAVEDAFRSIAVAARESEHFDAGIYEIVKGWSAGKPTTVHDIMITLPAVAGEVTAHVRATGDVAMKEAWDDLCPLFLLRNSMILANDSESQRVFSERRWNEHSAKFL
jgi:hypothetical protein